MLEIVQSGGWLMVPILLCSIIAAAIAGERSWTLQRRRVLPDNLLARTWTALKNGELGPDEMRETLVMLAPYAGYPNVTGLAVTCEEVINEVAAGDGGE